MNSKQILGAIAFPLFCLFASLFVLLLDPGFTSGLLHSVGKDSSIEPTKQLFLAFAGLGELPALFNAQEASHMEDVAQLLRAGFILFVAITMLFGYCARNTRIVRTGFLILAIMLLLLAIIPFETVFTQFHTIFFPQGNWTFEPNSMIIQTYPFVFFFWYAISIAAYAFFLGLTLFCEHVLSPRAIVHNTQKFK